MKLLSEVFIVVMILNFPYFWVTDSLDIFWPESILKTDNSNNVILKKKKSLKITEIRSIHFL